MLRKSQPGGQTCKGCLRLKLDQENREEILPLIPCTELQPSHFTAGGRARGWRETPSEAQGYRDN